MKKKAALLIGNGLNRASGESAWADLLSQLKKKHKLKKTPQLSNLPLEFQLIYFQCAKKIKTSQYALKKEIADLMSPLTDYSLLDLFTSLSIENILTTNYDYNLESSIDKGFRRKHSNTSEKKHSLHRKIELGTKTIWHIHGEKSCPNSICLGFDQYCAYLSRLHAYLTTPGAPHTPPFIEHQLLTDPDGVPSWATLLFTHDLYIVGFGLSFLESDLWWLLNYRAYLRLEKPHLNINNKIFYFYCKNDQNLLSEIIFLLKSMEIDTVSVQMQDSWPDFYRRVRQKIHKMIK